MSRANAGATAARCRHAAGRRAAQRVSAAWADVLEEALAGLDPGDRQELDRMMSSVLQDRVGHREVTPTYPAWLG